ncbi:MAG TPA: KaiC domain-containing protein [Defluviitoga sp.]|nr:KaiC domain-containing protein [Defluviitoga sp.]HOP24162.1 KaiC domain-containing protein [Defluviitoga sp.]HPZ29399.1 KaiC domain-containing protein [Defluviitoga sp.]HQD63458.1 KaiC domain-containing protein [Defluviitoga sp.]
MDELDFEKPKVVLEGISQISQAIKEAPKIEGLASGVEGLDDLFFTTEIVNKKVVKKSLGGIPSFSVFNVTGSSDTGKTLLAEQFAVKQAESGRSVVFVTAETPAAFVAVSLNERAKAMGIEFSKIEDQIILIDAASYSSLRENIPNLLATLEHVIKKYNVSITIIDSITGFYENKEMLARTVVRKIYNFLKKQGQTALLVSQKRSGHEDLTAEAAGGYAVGHIVDGTMVLAKELIMSQYTAKIYGKPIGEIVRLFRIDGCRLCAHDTRTHFLEITDTGILKIGNPLTANE